MRAAAHGVALAMFAAAGCGAEPVCDRGATQACLCVGGGGGAQACADDGSRWGVCDCATGGPAEGEGEGEAVDAPPKAEGEGEGEASEGEGEGEGEGAVPESCNGQDDDGDGRVDEVEVAVESLRVTFDPRTSVEPGRGAIEVAGRDDVPVQGSPFSGADLAGRTIDIPGNLVRIRLTADAQATPLFGYAVTSVVDQSGREAPGPLPESAHDHPAPVDDDRTFEMADSLGMGLTCGDDVGACTHGRTTCLGGRQVCTGDQRPSDELCNGLDDDCDGDADEPEDLTDTPPCDKTLGVCAVARPVCQGAEGYAPCNSQNYGPDYEVTELNCDCLDNDCDGVVDGSSGVGAADDALLGCTIDDLAVGGEGRDCVVQVSSTATLVDYRFGSLRIPDDITVAAEASLDGCGHRGWDTGNCGHPPTMPGGCFSVRADEVVVDGALTANAGPRSASCSNRESWASGPSGGNLAFKVGHLTVNGRVEANGGNGFYGSGGAAGSIRVRARGVIVSGTLRAAGGTSQGANERVGGGAGGPGGTGSIPGGGAGGPPSIEPREPGGEDPNRPLEITGRLTILDGGAIQSVNGAGEPAGYVRLNGHAVANADRVVGGAITENALAIHLMNDVGVPVEAGFRLVREGTEEAVAEGRTDEEGWATVDAPDLSVDLRHRFEVPDTPALGGGAVFLSFGDAGLQLGCALELGLRGDPPAVLFPAMQDCR